MAYIDAAYQGVVRVCEGERRKRFEGEVERSKSVYGMDLRKAGAAMVR